MTASPLLSRFEGEFLNDPVSLNAASDDFGHVVRRTPRAVVKPKSVDEVIQLVRYARARGIPLAPRGRGHSTQGQAQVEDGIVVDLTTLSAIRSIGSDRALVEGGVRWSTLLEQTNLIGLTPPTLTDYIELTVGGTLSVGGFGGQSFRFGAQTDNVLSLEVVTGTGERVFCSPEIERELFDACRAGLGQCGIIVGAEVKLVPVPPRARVYSLEYGSLPQSLADLRRLVDHGQFDYLGALPVPEGSGWTHHLFAVKYWSPPEAPDDSEVLSGLSFSRVTEKKDLSYSEFAGRYSVETDALTQAAERPARPLLDLLLPESQAVTFVDQVLTELSARGYLGGILIYPLRRSLGHTPLLQLPGEESLLLFDVLRVVDSPTMLDGELADNRRIYEQAVGLGATIYPVGSMPMTQVEWKRHFGAHWELLARAKGRFDPDGILTPGQGLFPRRSDP